MSSPFLVAFVDAVVSRLVVDGHLEIEPGGQPSVVTVVAARLSRAQQGESLISTLSAALISAEAVVELYADDMVLKELVTELPSTALPRSSS